MQNRLAMSKNLRLVSGEFIDETNRNHLIQSLKRIKHRKNKCDNEMKILLMRQKEIYLELTEISQILIDFDNKEKLKTQELKQKLIQMKALAELQIKSTKKEYVSAIQTLQNHCKMYPLELEHDNLLMTLKECHCDTIEEQHKLESCEQKDKNELQQSCDAKTKQWLEILEHVKTQLPSKQLRMNPIIVLKQKVQKAIFYSDEKEQWETYLHDWIRDRNEQLEKPVWDQYTQNDFYELQQYKKTEQDRVKLEYQQQKMDMDVEVAILEWLLTRD